MAKAEGRLYEVFIRPRGGLAHRHVGSVRADDREMAIQNARDAFTRRREGVSIWVLPSALITASDPADGESLFDAADDKVYRHPSFYHVPDDIDYM